MEKVSVAKQWFYRFKPLIPRRTQLWLRRNRANRIRNHVKFSWPIIYLDVVQPNHWQGWPNEKKFAIVLSHDVEWETGRDRCKAIFDAERDLGFRSCFNFVPERYQTSQYLIQKLQNNGFEVGVHGLKHDGKLYQSHQTFNERAFKINDYIHQWNARGVHTPARHHQLDWHHAWDVSYVSSTFDTDPFEPQSDGVKTLFPFCVADSRSNSTYIELPYTLPQDHCLYVILQEKTIDIWKKKLDWIAKNGGMAFVITHPDYMNIGDKPLGLEEYPLDLYKQFLTYIKTQYATDYWQALPYEVADFWQRANVQTKYDHMSSLKVSRENL